MSIIDVKIQEYLEQLILGQKTQAERDTAVLSEVSRIRETVERLHNRLDEIHETTIVHSEKIRVLDINLIKQIDDSASSRELMWKKMREYRKSAIDTAKSDIKLWIYGTLLIGISSVILTILKV